MDGALAAATLLRREKESGRPIAVRNSNEREIESGERQIGFYYFGETPQTKLELQSCWTWDADLVNSKIIKKYEIKLKIWHKSCV